MATATSSICSLPVPLLARVLEHVDPKHRLSSCLLVCSTWHTAAAMATDSVSIPVRTPDAPNQLHRWLQHRHPCMQLKKLHLDGTDGEGISWGVAYPLQLPLQQLTGLQELVLGGVRLLPAAAAVTDAAAGATAQLQAADPSVIRQATLPPSLTSLELWRCHIDLSALPAVTGLRDLTCACCFSPPALPGPSATATHQQPQPQALGPAALAPAAFEALAEVLPHMVALTSLVLHGNMCRQVAVLQVARLPQLQWLALKRDSDDDLAVNDVTEAAFAVLPQTLTYLEIDCLEGSCPISPQTAPGIHQLTALQTLLLECSCKVDLSVLEHITSLQHLQLQFCLITGPPGQPRLTVLQQLTKLQHLQLPEFVDVVDPLFPDPNTPRLLTAAEAAALTASPHLTVLDVGRGCGWLKASTFGFMFPSGLQLPHLTRLICGPQLLGNTAAVQHMRAACPALHSLVLYGDRHSTHDNGVGEQQFADSLAALSGLSRLEALCLMACPGYIRNAQWRWSTAAWAVLAGLTGLKHLHLALPGHQLQGLMELTALKKLSGLVASTLGPSLSGVAWESLAVYSQAPRGSPPDVWYRIPFEVCRKLKALLEQVERHCPPVASTGPDSGESVSVADCYSSTKQLISAKANSFYLQQQELPGGAGQPFDAFADLCARLVQVRRWERHPEAEPAVVRAKAEAVKAAFESCHQGEVSGGEHQLLDLIWGAR